MILLGKGIASLTDLSATATVVASTVSGGANLYDVANDPGFVLDLNRASAASHRSRRCSVH